MTIANAGLLEKSAGAAATDLQQIVNNTGTILAHSGTLILDDGGASESGSIFNIDNNATLTFGSGAYTMKSGTVLNETAARTLHRHRRASSADASLLTGKNLQMNGVELAINGNLDTDQFAWNSGVLVGTGTTKLQSDITMSSVTWGIQGGRTLDTNGKNFTVSGSPIYGNAAGASFNLPGVGTIDNKSGSTFTMSVTSIADLGQANHPAELIFNNSGTFTTSNDEIRVWAQMNNDGNFTIGNGTASFMGGGTSSGAFTANNSTLKFVGSATHTLSSTSSITGNGDIIFDAPQSDVSGTIDSTGTVTTGSTSTTVANFNSPAQIQTPLFTAAGGTINLKSGASLKTNKFLMQAGTANIDGTLTISATGEMDLTGGEMIASSTSSITSPKTSNNATLRINSGAILTAGTYTQLGAESRRRNACDHWGRPNSRRDHRQRHDQR